MKKDLITATFVNNSEFYKYPVKLWKQALDGFELKIFKGRKVNEPMDISIIQNECLEELFKDYHNVFWVQADIIFIPGMKDMIMSCVGNDVCFQVSHVKRYYLQDVTHFGIALVNKERFEGDGAYMEHYAVHPVITAVDAGYFGEENYRNHVKQQSDIWKQPIPPYRKDTIIEPSGYFEPIFDYFNLYEEYKNFKK